MAKKSGLQRTIEKEMHVWKHGIPMSNKRRIKSQEQALAIAYSKEREKGRRRR